MYSVTIYTATYCPYCVKAKKLLNDRDITFKEIDVTEDHEMREKLVEMTGGRKTVPQIFINDKSVGGFTDIEQLDKTGELQRLLNSN